MPQFFKYFVLISILLTCPQSAHIATGFDSSEFRHDTPDGFVERAIAIVVKDRQIEVTVQIGINAKTMIDKLAEWEITEEFQDETQLTDRFCKEIQERLIEKFELTLDDQKLPLQVSSVAPFAEHHKTAVLKLTATIPDGIDSGAITFLDSSFEQLDGAARFAIKGRGGALVTRSNVAPIIIRAQRHELGALTISERKQICQIQARVKIVERRHDP